MRPYEVMVILDPRLEDDATRAAVDRFADLVRTQGGNLGRVDRWGKRRLAYELNHHLEGYYVLYEATAEPAVMEELHRALSLSDEVIRHKVIRVPDAVAGRRRPSGGGDAPAAPAAPSGNGA
jgi:small subunit ribosomal protein S6